MKIIVPIKRVIDHSANVRVTGNIVDTENVRMSINPFDEVALAQAIRFRDEGFFNEVITVSLGESKTTEQLKTSLAQGADRAILITGNRESDSVIIAKALQYIVLRENADLVLMGKQSSDSDSGSVGEILSVVLGWPCVPYASKIEIQKDSSVKIQKETDHGVQIWQVNLPAVITADLHLNDPRPVSIKDMIAAKKKIIETINIDEINLINNIKKSFEVIDTEEHTGHRQPQKVESVDELASELKKRLEQVK